MVNWDSHNATPPSLLYPAEGNKWYARHGLAHTQTVTAPNGKTACIGELRGWLREVDGGCNDGDPDWFYNFELDAEWMDAQQIPFEVFLLPGDVLGHEDASILSDVQARSSVRAKYAAPICNVELDGWQRSDPHRGQPPQPASWTFHNDCNGGTTVWPFDPRNPKAGDPPLAVGQHVRIVGSLVTDAPHMMRDQLATNTVLRFGYGAAVGMLGPARADAGQENAIKWLWGPNQTETDENHPARYNEVHSPDYIGVLPAKSPSETVRCVAVVAQNGLFVGDTEEITAVIRPPSPRPSPSHVLSYSKHVGPNTIGSTVLLDEMQVAADHITVHVRVQGQAGMGASGKFFAIYRVGWRLVTPAPQLCVDVQPYPVPLNQAVAVTVRAVDCVTHAAVAGTVKIGGVTVGNTNTPFTYTFRLTRQRVRDPELGWIIEMVPPHGEVSAPNYPTTAIDFGL